MRRVLVDKCQRLGWCSAAPSLAVFAVLGVLSGGAGFAETAQRDPDSERDRAIHHLVLGNAEITRGDTPAALQNYLLAQRLFEHLLSHGN